MAGFRGRGEKSSRKNKIPNLSFALSFPFTNSTTRFFQANSAKLEPLQTSRALIRPAAAVTELDQNVSVAGLGITPAPQYFAAQFG
jgi:hypothetical protein